jgi:hypothetical protein
MGPGRPRRFVQIAATCESQVLQDGRVLPHVLVPVVYALADDGSVWGIGAAAETWRRLPELPPEEVP